MSSLYRPPVIRYQVSGIKNQTLIPDR